MANFTLIITVVLWVLGCREDNLCWNVVKHNFVQIIQFFFLTGSYRICV